MLYHLLHPLARFSTIFNLFGYITVRSVIAFIIALLLSFVFFPLFIRFMTKYKMNQIIREEGPKSHQGKVGTPTMGGIIVIINLLIALLISGRLDNRYIWVLTFATIAFGIVGFIDDYLKLSKKNTDGMHAKLKLISQFLIAFVISVTIYFFVGLSQGENIEVISLIPDFIKTRFPILLDNTFAYIAIPFLKDVRIDLSILYIPLGMFIIVAFSNAVNLTDGLDGLASGLLIPVVATLGLITYVSGHQKMAEYLYLDLLPLSSEVLVYCFAFTGALAGFLWYNSHPAQVFMGDTGSLAFGGIIATIAMLVKQELLIAILGGVFVAETLSVIIQVWYYKISGKRIFLMAPLHHHFELKGWKESKIIARFYILGGILAIIALGSLKLR